MTTVIAFEDDVEIPAGLRDLAEFRRWCLSDEFPARGRIDYLDGRIEVDMSPEDLFTHGTAKTKVAAILDSVIDEDRRGYLFVDSTRIACPDANLSVEPDIVFLSYEAVRSGRAVLVSKASASPQRFVEIEGPPDLIVEVVSDSSASKDKRRLQAAYFEAGIDEYWLIDARKDLTFVIQTRGADAFQSVAIDADGFQASAVLQRSFRLRRERDVLGHWKYALDVKGVE